MKDYSEHIACLERVRKSLTRRNGYICFLIDPEFTSPETYDELRCWIRELLYSGGRFCPSLDSWLLHVHGINVLEYPADEASEYMRQLRLRWVDWMIAELSREGE